MYSRYTPSMYYRRARPMYMPMCATRKRKRPQISYRTRSLAPTKRAKILCAKLIRKTKHFRVAGTSALAKTKMSNALLLPTKGYHMFSMSIPPYLATPVKAFEKSGFKKFIKKCQKYPEQMAASQIFAVDSKGDTVAMEVYNNLVANDPVVGPLSPTLTEIVADTPLPQLPVTPLQEEMSRNPFSSGDRVKKKLNFYEEDYIFFPKKGVS